MGQYRTIAAGRTAPSGQIRRPLVLLQLLGEHDDDAAGAADVRDLVNVLIGRHAAKRTAAVPGSRALSMSSTEKATRCMPISLGLVGFDSIDLGWMYSKSSRRP